MSLVSVWVEQTDRDPLAGLTWAAAGGLVVAALLARLGMPPVNLHSPLHFAGIMDPLCGMTRGSAATLRGDLRRAWWYNPASPLVILGGLAVLARWVVGRVTGGWLSARVKVTRVPVAVAGVVLAALELNRQLHVDRLR
jgi:hypothetical protein